MTEHEEPQPPPPGSEEPGTGGNGPSSTSRQNGDVKKQATRISTGEQGTPRPRSPLPPSRRWLLWAAGGLFLVLFVLVFVNGPGDGPNLPPRTVEDQEFVRQADSACARSLPALRRDRARRRTGDEGREAALAGTVERAAAELERLAGEVRGIPVAAVDQGEVSGWLRDWDAYVATGRRFADALRRSDNKSYAGISAESTELSERIYAFSKANGMSECVF